jgi:hypothetical protein
VEVPAKTDEVAEESTYGKPIERIEREKGETI